MKLLYFKLLSFFFCAFFICISEGISQQQFTVFHHQSTSYKGGSQNWEICKDEKGRVFVATSNGLLMLDGAQPRMLEMKDKTIIRSVKSIGDRVYIGSFQEFGFWQEVQNGEWEYTSLIPLVDKSRFQNDEIWKIVEADGMVYFQSFGNIFKYDQKNVEPLDLPGPVLFLLKSGGRIFTQAINGALYELINNKLHLIEGSDFFATTEVKSMFKLSNGRFVIGTASMGLYLFDGLNFTAWDVPSNHLLKEYKINGGTMLGDKIILGTILKGIFVLDQQGELLQHLNSSNGLQNNTVLSLYADKDLNLWVGLDKGFDFIWFHSPVEKNNEPEMGSSYTAALYKGKLYVGTNQGVFYFETNSRGDFIKREFVQGTQGQVWFLKVLNNQLYCGLNNGTYIIDEQKLRKVSSINGGYNLKPFRVGEEELMLQSTYNEIVVFKKVDDIWTFARSLNGFIAPARFLEVDHMGNMILGHSIKGLYLLKADPLFETVVENKLLGFEEGLSFQTNRVFKVDNRIVVPSGEQLFEWDAVSCKFSPWDTLNKQLGSFACAETIIPIGLNTYWFIKKDEIGMFEIRFDKARLIYRIIPEMFDLQLVDLNESIVDITNNKQLICLEDGFGILDLTKMTQLNTVSNPPEMKQILFSQASGNKKLAFNTLLKHKPQLSNGYNNATLSFSMTEMTGRLAYYQYYLEGLENSWSKWNTSTKITYTRLPPGNYTFNVRGLTSVGMPTETTSVTFKIRPPWYLSWYAYAGYVILTIAFFLLLWHSYRRRQWLRQEKALKEENELMKSKSSQAEAELFKLSNDKLHTEITMKNMELAKNTMAMIKKNELLIEIRKELNQQKEELGSRLPTKYYSKISKLIETSINSEHDWEMFEYLFDQAHENFFKRLKQAYPELTPSDFRLCAYLRMNLTSKEIAPLLNITIRGIEEKRYRLRKKINLQPDQNLTEFIINF
ncbi:MAG: YYY domain-containing protein [Bacteroidetes bacterium]|nr:MAG: YYY domain-containing protein [Bacteroidota bacterium]